MRRAISILLTVAAAVMLSGCNNSRQIETASIIKNVSVDRRGGQVVYTFYRLSSSEKPWGIDVPADSFEHACALARERYIPNLSLAKLELLMLSEDVYRQVMQDDVDYISTQASFSPIAYVTLCDDGAIERIKETNRTQSLMEEQLILLKKNNPSVNINYLSIFNNFARRGEDSFTVPFISSEKELKVSEFEIDREKMKKTAK